MPESTAQFHDCVHQRFQSSVRRTQGGENSADHLPPRIKHVTWFGERADWLHDGKKILFLTKTFGDAMELDLATKRIRDLTTHYPHHGFTRALYLANGDVLLSGPESLNMDSRQNSQIGGRGRSGRGSCIFESSDIRTAFIENPDSVGALVKPDRIVGPAVDAIDKPHGVSGNR